MIPEDVHALNTLRQLADFFDVSHRSTFRCLRNTKAGMVQEVIVEILDAGPDASPRFHVRAEAKDGKTASGKPHDHLEGALALVHWLDLD